MRRAPYSPSGRDEMDVTVQDIGSGLQAIRDVQVTNGTVSVAPFTPGTTAPVVVTATKTTQGYPTRWSFYADDVAGNAKLCVRIDLDVIGKAGQPVAVTEPGVPGAGHPLTVRNATPGITTLRVEVNGAQLKPLTLADGATTTVDIGAHLRPDNDNSVVLTASGKPGARRSLSFTTEGWEVPMVKKRRYRKPESRRPRLLRRLTKYTF